MLVKQLRRGAAALGVLALTATVVPATATAALGDRGRQGADDPMVIADGLNNPRGLTFRRNGVLFVAEAGTGGSAPCIPGPEGGESCFGLTGSVTRIGHHSQRRVLTDLPSLAEKGTGATAIGPSDVAFRKGKMYVTVGLGLDLDVSRPVPELDAMGELLVADPPFARGGVESKTFAELSEFEDANNPTGDEENSNPNSVLAARRGLVVSDAGANDLLRVSPSGEISVLATFPNTEAEAPAFLGLPPGSKIPMDAVPTSVTRGPDGALYVGQLTGFPFPEGGASVFRVAGGKAKAVATGFTNIIDIAFDRHGRLYVLEIFTNGLLSEDPTGALIRVGKDGSQEVLMSEGLITPGGLAIRGHHAYVSNCSTCPGEGEVLRIPLH